MISSFENLASLIALLFQILPYCGVRELQQRQSRRSLSLMLSDMLICGTLSGLLTLKTHSNFLHSTRDGDSSGLNLCHLDEMAHCEMTIVDEAHNFFLSLSILMIGDPQDRLLLQHNICSPIEILMDRYVKYLYV